MCNALSCRNASAGTQTRPVCFFAHSHEELRVVETYSVPLECLVSIDLSFLPFVNELSRSF